MKRSTIKDMTRGSVWKNLILFAIPLLLGSLVQQLYNTVDLIFAGNFIDKSASAAIGTSGMLVNCLVGFFGGMSVGSGVVISQIFGSGDIRKLKKAIHNAMALSLVGGMILMLVGWILAPWYLQWINTPVDLLQSATRYLRIYFLSMISVLTYNIGSGVCRALGDSQSPLYAQFFGGLINVVMDYLFIRIFANGVNGVAWATLFSQTCAALIIIYRLRKLDADIALRWKEICFDGELLREVIRIGIPAGTQSLVITLSNVFVQSQINTFGEDAIAAFTAYFKVELLIYLPIVAFGQAMMTFAGQNKGAGNYGRIRKGTVQCVSISIVIAVLTSLFAIGFGEQLFRIFNKETSVIALGCSIIRVTFPFYFLYCILQILGDSIRGCGEVKKPMMIVMTNICVIRTILLFFMVHRFQSVQSVAAVYPITWLLTAVCMMVCYVRFRGD